jgi:hypothetical protein
MNSALDPWCVRAVVLGRVQEESLRIILGPGQGQLDGGTPIEVPLAQVPPALRMPNTEVEVMLARGSGEILEVRRPRPDEDRG